MSCIRSRPLSNETAAVCASPKRAVEGDVEDVSSLSGPRLSASASQCALCQCGERAMDLIASGSETVLSLFHVSSHQECINTISCCTVNVKDARYFRKTGPILASLL